MGTYRRRIRMVALDSSTVRADLEDDFHRFGLTLHHDGTSVTAVDGDALRFPWTSCPGAVEPLHAVTGAPLSTRTSALGEHTDARANCTHLFDLAGLALAHAARMTRAASADGAARVYDVSVADRDSDHRTSAVVARDGTTIFEWELHGRTIVSPIEFSSVGLGRGFLAWTDANLDADAAEAAAVIRRACHISFGRVMDLDDVDHADELREVMLGTCHTFQPGTIETSLRVKRQTRDFTETPDALLR